MRRRLLFLSLLLVPLAARAQQVGVLTHDAVLHDGPSRTAPRLGDLAAGETVSLLRREHRNGYLQVRTQTEDVGWVWELYVHLVDPTEVHEPTTPHTLVPSPLGVDVPAGDFDNCPDSGDARSEEHTSELQSRGHLVCRLLLEQKNGGELTSPSALIIYCFLRKMKCSA